MPPPTSADPSSDLRSERDRFLAFAFAAADLLIEVSDDGRIAYAVGAAQAMTGRGAKALIGAPFDGLLSQSHRAFAKTVLRKVKQGRRIAPVKVELDREGAAGFSVVLSGGRLPTDTTRLYFAFSSEAKLPDPLDAAARDEETGLLDPRGFQNAAAATLNAMASGKQDVSLALLDLQGIDELRAGSGDGAVADLLGEIGNFLNANSIDGASAGRLSTDRFAVLQSAGSASDLGGEIERLSKQLDPSGHGLSVKEKVIPLSPGSLSPADAERALGYTLSNFVKSGGELSIRSLADGFRELVTETIGRISQLRSSTTADRLNIVFQPVVRLDDAGVHHYEVLSRFASDGSPAEMIKFAESVGMIEELDLTVCQRVLAFIDGDAATDRKYAVNISGRSMQSDIFIGALRGLLSKLPDASRLLFEITETVGITDLARANRIIQDFRRAGHSVCIDDFGAGAASFAYLQALMVDFVKIDGAYVNRALDSMRDHVILKAIAGMCRQLKTATIAEMIETEAQAQRLTELGVEFGQGYLFGKPAPTPMVKYVTIPKPSRGKSRSMSM